MKVHVKNLLVNRSDLTRQFKMAGSPVTQMATHAPTLDGSPRAAFEESAYSSIREASAATGKHHSYASLDTLLDDIKCKGVLEDVIGWHLGEGVYELYGGHHRAVMVHVAGIETIELSPKSLPLNGETLGQGLKDVKKKYAEVPKSEPSLRVGRSYNPCPGFIAHRPTAEKRLQMIYRAIIDCSGSSLIDLGCNDGYFGAALALHDFDVTFVDRSRAYLDVVEAKMKAIGKQYHMHYGNIEDFLQPTTTASVILYTDVFYHTAVAKGKDAAIDQLQQIIARTEERLIFAPGRWDSLEKHGVTQRLIYSVLTKLGKRIRYLGCDGDKNYGREIYCVSY